MVSALIKNSKKPAFKWALFLILIFSFTSASDVNSFTPNKVSTFTGVSPGALGKSVNIASDIDGDGIKDLLIGDNAQQGSIGAVYVIYGGVNLGTSNFAFSTTLDPSVGFKITGFDTTGELGWAVTSGDVDHDGFGDIIIGASYASSNLGIVYVIYGCSRSARTSIDLSSLTPSSTGFKIVGDVSSGQFGYSVSAGDINSDGYDDIVVGAFSEMSQKGAAYIVYGGPRGSFTNLAGSTLNPATTGFKITGASGSFCGWSVSVGKIDGDAYADIVIGARGSNTIKGVVYVIYGGAKSSLPSIDLSSVTLSASSSPPGFTITGATASDYLGSSVSVGDIDKDGYGDLVVGASQANSNTGMVYVVFGAQSRLSSIDLSNGLYSPSGFKMTGKASGDYFGWSVSCVGDVNKDGYKDIVIGAKGGSSNIGGVYVKYGQDRSSLHDILWASATLDLFREGFSLSGISTTSNGLFGMSVNNGGDVNHDGYDDIIIGASGENKAYLLIYNRCPDHCTTCDFPSKCSICLSPWGLTSNFDCVCAAGTYDSGTTCSSCPSSLGCPTCSSPTTCTTCSAGSYLYQGTCGSSCPVTTYKNAGICSACPSNCDTCSDSNTCTACTPPYLVSINQCVLHSCSPNCDDCSSSSVCTTCSSGYYLYQDGCYNPCPQITYPSTSTVSGTTINICKDCSLNCAVCTDSSTCTTCSTGSYLYQGGCLSSCPVKTYISGSTCSACPSNCDVCTDSSTCTTCSSGYYVNQNACIGCSSNCDTCTDSSHCTSCSLTYYLYQDGCVQSCPLRTYALPSFGRLIPSCKACPLNCDVCSDSSTCTTCSPGFYLDSNTCQGCPLNCDVCSNSTTCITCSTGFYLYQNACIQSCPAKTYTNGAVCSDCSSGCNKCSNLSTCITCSQNFLMYQAQCYSTCPSTTYPGGTNCLDCSSNCNTCTSGTSCTACSPGSHLWQQSCYNPCPTKTFTLNATSCGACPSNCDICSNSSTCSTCSQNYFFYQGQCYGSCPSQTFTNGNACSACPTNCYQCTNSTTCLTCSGGFLLSGPDCVDVCPAGSYPSGRICQGCPTECSKCTGESDCQACSHGFVKYKSQCLTECPAKTYLQSSESACFDCSEGCLKCTSATECEVCEDGYIVSDSSCVQNIKETAKDKAPPALFESTSLVGASLTSGSSLPLNFGLVAKILRNIKYMDLTVSPDLQKTFYSWKVATGFMSAPDSLKEKSPSKDLPYVFGRYALQPVFLVNYWKPFFMTIIGFVLFVIFKALEIKLEKEKEKKAKFYSISRQINVAASNFALTQFYSNLDDVILYFAIELRSTDYDSGFKVFSCGVAIILGTIGVIILSFHSSLLGKYQSLKREKSQSLEAFTQKYENYKLIFSDFKDTNYLTQSFLFFNLLRALISSLIIATLYEYPGVQIAFLLILNLAMLTFLSVKKPFKDLIDTCGQIFCELVLLIANISVLILILCDQGDSIPYDTVERLSQCIIVLNFILLFGCAILLLVSIGKILYKAYQERKQEKKSLEKSQASTDMKGLFSSAKFSRPNQSLENKTDQSIMPMATNDLSGELFNNASRIYQNSHLENSPDLSYTHNLTGFESPNMLFKQEPMAVSESYIAENPLDFNSEAGNKNSRKEEKRRKGENFGK